jgi:hypothetical protein
LGDSAGVFGACLLWLINSILESVCQTKCRL